MMGCQVAPAQLFYDFCLDDHVPADHMLRIDRHLELGGVRTHMKPFYSSSTGRPSTDPKLIVRILTTSGKPGACADAVRMRR